ncbi:MAG TPA: RES family NAD+ phosphorylase [Pedobacter sp.]|uniref:RES family NAD+ phosphorylase n=1 Tax=Pedobacter sp. TaxID=1411316 RepID=UPI002CE59C00|nr:RES family NAD+ phosphorylase [Pedobacter sp.]HMI04852.1 RES family NAD+ phosphorylase [Pedobacter sp.]
MLVYRLSRTSYASDLEGTGAKLYGGRWNNKGTVLIYTSASRALAVLEFASNVELEFLPDDLSVTTYEIPEKDILTVPDKDLPQDWDQLPAPQSAKDFGSSYFKDQKILCLRVPSVVVQQEYNYLINPESSKFKAVRVMNISPFEFDSRIKK